jgi:hypothetical protein
MAFSAADPVGMIFSKPYRLKKNATLGSNALAELLLRLLRTAARADRADPATLLNMVWAQHAGMSLAADDSMRGARSQPCRLNNAATALFYPRSELTIRSLRVTTSAFRADTYPLRDGTRPDRPLMPLAADDAVPFRVPEPSGLNNTTPARLHSLAEQLLRPSRGSHRGGLA